MKKLLMLLVVFAAALTPSAEAAYRDIILEKLEFFYIDDPSIAFAGYPATEIDKLKIARGETIISPLWTNSDNDGLQALLEDLLHDESQGGDEDLQRIVAAVLTITSKKVRIFLYHDNANAVRHPTMPIYSTDSTSPTGHINTVWPAGAIYTNDPIHSGAFGIGSYFYTPNLEVGGYETEIDKKGVFIHELVHTQLIVPLEGTLGNLNYDGVDGHYTWEMLPSRNGAFEEGIANAFWFLYHMHSQYSVTSALNANQKLFADDNASCSSATFHCLQHRLAASLVASAGGCSAGTDCYNIRDIPAEVILHNEMIYANVLYQVCAQVGNSTAILVAATRRAATDIANNSNYGFIPLFKELTKSALNYHNSNNPPGTRTHGQFMPIAILDYYTGYKIPDKATLERVLGTTWESTDTNIDDYFRRHRATLIGYRPNATTWRVNHLNRLARHLNVRTPRTAQDSASDN